MPAQDHPHAVPETIPEEDFEPVAPLPGCPHCLASDADVLPGVDAVYCIALREQPIRAAAAIAHLHEIGLCSLAVMYRPSQGVHVPRAIWRSHATIARRALSKGQRCVLSLEDDARFAKPAPVLRERVAAAFAKLGKDWWCLYLGHLPIESRAVAPGLAAVRTLCTHAFIANEPLLRWLARTEPMDPTLASIWGGSLDCHMARLPGMYAVTPMLAVQRRVGEMRVDHRAAMKNPMNAKHIGLLLGNINVYFLARPAEVIARVFGTSVRRSVIERRSANAEKLQLDAIVLRESGLFDTAFYLARHPDVVAGDMHPLRHYLAYGAAERRWPNRLFDPDHYLAGVGDVAEARRNPLLHYLTHGAREGRDPHPMFDSGWYVDQNADVTALGLNPLAHFLNVGWREGRAPSPRFSVADVLAADPDMARPAPEPDRSAGEAPSVQPGRQET